MTEQRAGCPSGALYAQSLSLAVLGGLWGRHAQRMPRAERNGLTPSRLAALCDFMHSESHADVTLDQLAALVGLSPKHLCRSFKASTGLSPYQYLLRVRVEAAKRAMRVSADSLTHIALACGFGSSSHFSTTFRKITGLTPKAFRRRT